jgi:hypothetical protein
MIDDLVQVQTEAFESAASAVKTSLAAWTTINIRLGLMAMGAMTGREARMMVNEKAVAATQGVLNSAAAMFNAAIDPPLTAGGLMRKSIEVARAATKPAEKKAQANARRLKRKLGY